MSFDKEACEDADSTDMKLSAEEAHHAYCYRQQKGLQTVELATSTDLPVDFLERAIGTIASAPDPRPERVAAARQTLHHHFPTSGEVAERMLWRALADSLR